MPKRTTKQRRHRKPGRDRLGRFTKGNKLSSGRYQKRDAKGRFGATISTQNPRKQRRQAGNRKGQNKGGPRRHEVVQKKPTIEKFNVGQGAFQREEVVFEIAIPPYIPPAGGQLSVWAADAFEEALSAISPKPDAAGYRIEGPWSAGNNADFERQPRSFGSSLQSVRQAKHGLGEDLREIGDLDFEDFESDKDRGSGGISFFLAETLFLEFFSKPLGVLEISDAKQNRAPSRQSDRAASKARKGKRR